MIPKGIKACSWCGCMNATMMTYDGSDVGKPDEYSIRCNRCGWASKKSRFKWRTRWFWNHMNNPITLIATKKQGRRYHLYGREF